MQFNHLNLVVENPEHSATFYARLLGPDARQVWLGDSLHLRDGTGADLAFQRGTANPVAGAHHGFLAPDAAAINELFQTLQAEQMTITDNCDEGNFRSIKFLDPDGYEIEVYWEQDWP